MEKRVWMVNSDKEKKKRQTKKKFKRTMITMTYLLCNGGENVCGMSSWDQVNDFVKVMKDLERNMIR